MARSNCMERTIKEAIDMVRYGYTVRQVAKVYEVSKSTVHRDVTKRLRELDYVMFVKVRKVLMYNKSQRHIRGGMANKARYLKRSENN